MKNPNDPTPAKGPSQIGGRIWKSLMGLFLIGLGWIFVVYLWNSHRRAAVMDNWVETPCRIVSAEIDDSQLNQRGMPKYLVEIRYEYLFEGKSHTGDRLTRLPAESSDLRKAKGRIKSYPAGSEATSYVNPADPSVAVLKKDSKAGLYTIWFPCLFIVGGAGMILTALFRRRP